MENIVEVIGSSQKGGNTLTTISFKKLPSAPIAPASIRLQSNPDADCIDLAKVESIEGNTVMFISYGSFKIELGLYAFSSWWMPWQLVIAQSDAKNWQRTLFKSSKAVSFRFENGTTMVRKAGEKRGSNQ